VANDPVEEFKEGVISPIQGVMVTLFFYIFTLIVAALKNATPKNSFTDKLIITPDSFIILLAILIIVLTIFDAIKDIRQSYYNPPIGIAKTFGTIVGTAVFWWVLVQITIISGGSQFDVIVASILAIGSPLMGIFLRNKLNKR
jgi:succinate dehydrogenase/fumarate reductase cytochrome b subunit